MKGTRTALGHDVPRTRFLPPPTLGQEPSTLPRGDAPDALSRADRFRAGKALRKKVSRSSQGTFHLPRDRKDIVQTLIDTGRDRVPSLLPIRYGRMAISPFHFFRGAAAIMAHDVAAGPISGLRVQITGDAHLSNFGIFATPERDQVFDANDFDETMPGPWEWDVKRLATSLILVSRYRGFGERVAQRAARVAARAYRRHMLAFARMRYLDLWYFHLDLQAVTKVLERKAQRLMEHQLARSHQRTGFHAFPKMAKPENGRFRIRDNAPLITHYPGREEERAVQTVFERYRSTLPTERRVLLDRYHLVDIAQKVVGIGSVGTRCAVGLFLADKDVLDPLFLQVKEAVPSAYEGILGPSRYTNHAERVVVGERLAQSASDIFLGWASSGSHDFYVRQLRDMKFCTDITALGPKALFGQAELCAAALSRAHARTGDPAAIAGYLGEGDAFDKAVVSFALAYAAQTETDHATMLKAIDRGRLPFEKIE